MGYSVAEDYFLCAIVVIGAAFCIYFDTTPAQVLVGLLGSP